jgi:hypothetical protein
VELRRHLVPDEGMVVASGDSAAPLLAAIVAWSRVHRLDLSTLEVGPPTLEDAYLALTHAEECPDYGTEPSHA